MHVVEDWLEEPDHKHPKLEIAAKAWFRLDELPEGLTPGSDFGLARAELYPN